MQYALLIYGRPEHPSGPMEDEVATVLSRPQVTGWARLHSEESATTLRDRDGQPLMTDGPFIDSKEYLAGLVVIDVDNLDAALAVAQDLQDARHGGGAIEIRPMLESLFRGT